MNGGECPTIIGPMPFPGPAHRDVVARIAADHAVDLRRFLATRLADLSEREEVLQETFLRLAGYDAVADLDNPRAFLFRVAENLVRDRSRRARTRRRDLHEPLDGHHLTDPAPEPDIVVEHRDALTRTRAAILALDEPQMSREDLNRAVKDWGGVTLHDVIDDQFARKAVEKGATGLIAVAAGAGGHAGRLSPFALMQEIRSWFDGPVALSGSIASGRSILAAQAMGADFAYIGSPFIATEEARASQAYKDCIVASAASDIVYSSHFTGVHGNYLRPSIIAAGMDPDDLPEGDPGAMDFGSGATKAWRDIWGCGQGIGVIDRIHSARNFILRLEQEYQAVRSQICVGQ